MLAQDVSCTRTDHHQPRLVKIVNNYQRLSTNVYFYKYLKFVIALVIRHHHPSLIRTRNRSEQSYVFNQLVPAINGMTLWTIIILHESLLSAILNR